MAANMSVMCMRIHISLLDPETEREENSLKWSVNFLREN
jgi:hypothetical protein